MEPPAAKEPRGSVGYGLERRASEEGRACGGCDRRRSDSPLLLRVLRLPGPGASLAPAGASRGGQGVRYNERSMTERRVRALLRNNVETRGNAAHLHGHRAVVFAAATAAGRELRVVRSRSKCGRNQRQAEDRQQQYGERASHGVHLTGPGDGRRPRPASRESLFYFAAE